jgi:hypothetical protein
MMTKNLVLGMAVAVAAASVGPASAAEDAASRPRPVVSSTASPEPPPELPGWTLTLAGGGTATFQSGLPMTSPSWDLGAQLEAHRHLGSWFAGLAADAGPRTRHPFGGAVLVGAQVRALRLAFEASGGVGVERFGSRLQSPGGSIVETQTAVYGRAALAAVCPLSRQFDAIAQLTGHLTATSYADPTFVLAAFGFRLKLP